MPEDTRHHEELFPPHSLDAERSVLAAMMLSSESKHTGFEILSGEEFYSNQHMTLFDVFKRCYVKDKPLDAQVVKAEAEKHGALDTIGGMDFLLELYNEVATGANIASYCAIVKARYERRKLLEAATAAVRDCYDESINIRDIANTLESQLYNVDSKSNSGGIRHIGQAVKGALEHANSVHGQGLKSVGISSGCWQLDRITLGFKPGEFIILAGRPSMGKTSFALHCIKHAAEDGKHIVFFSLETGEDQLGVNMLAMESKVNSRESQLGRISTIDLERMMGAAGDLYDLPIYFDDDPELTVYEIRSRIMRYAKRNPVDFVVIDYLQYINGANKRDERRAQVTEISRRLKSMCKTMDIPIMALSQLNRNTADRSGHRPMPSDLKESGDIEQDADIVLLLHREDYYSDDAPPNELEIIVAKNRNGATGTAKLSYRRDIAQFSDIRMEDGHEEKG